MYLRLDDADTYILPLKIERDPYKIRSVSSQVTFAGDPNDSRKPFGIVFFPISPGALMRAMSDAQRANEPWLSVGEKDMPALVQKYEPASIGTRPPPGFGHGPLSG